MLDRGYIIRDASGRATRMIGAMVDLTERRQAERRIEYLAYHMRLILSITAMFCRARKD